METKQNTTIHIAFFISNLYAKHCATTMASILYNAEETDFHRFYIISSNLTQYSKVKLKSLKKIKEFEIEFINFDKSHVADIPDNIAEHVSFETNSRLKIASLLPELDKIICMDCDLIVLKSLKDLWETDISHYESACTLDPPTTSELFKKQTNLENYFNTGIMLANLKMWRQNNVEEKIFAAIKQHQKILRFPDQDSLNIAIKKMKTLDNKYNILASYLDYYSDALKNEMIKNPTVIHWAGTKKPWNESNVKFSNIYWKYATKSHFFMGILNDYLKNKTSRLRKNTKITHKVIIRKLQDIY